MADLRTKEMVYEELNGLIKAYNELIQAGKFSESKSYDDQINKVKNEYAGMVRTECFNELARHENPMLAAITRLTYKTIRVCDTKIKDENDKLTIPCRVIEDAIREIDLLKFHNHMKNSNSYGIGADTNWQYYIEKLNFLMTARTVLEVNKENPKKKEIKLEQINSSYAMNSISRDLDMGKTPTSNTALLKCLNIVVQAMLGEEFKAKSQDVAYVLDVYHKGGRNQKALSVMCANHKTLRQIMCRVCHNIVTGNGYDVESKEIKEKKSE